MSCPVNSPFSRAQSILLQTRTVTFPEEAARIFDEFLEDNCLNDYDYPDVGAVTGESMFAFENFDYSSPAHEALAAESISGAAGSEQDQSGASASEDPDKRAAPTDIEQLERSLLTPRRRRQAGRALVEVSEPLANSINTNPSNAMFGDLNGNDALLATAATNTDASATTMDTDNDNCNLNVNTCDSTDVNSIDLTTLATLVSGTL